MKKLRESAMAKLAAWVICVTAVMGTIVLGICLIYGICDDLFGQTREETLKSAYEHVNAYYSMQIFQAFEEHYVQEVQYHDFKYGIIKTSLNQVDFHDSFSYVDTNMTEQELAALEPDQLYLYRIIERDVGAKGMRMGYYGDYEDVLALDEITREDSEWAFLYADGICYDVSKGILYYRAEGQYYPVQNVSLCYDGSKGQIVYDYVYDFDRGGYILNNQSQKEELEWTDEENQQLEEVQPDEVSQIEEILGGGGIGGMVNLADLNDTAFVYPNWGTILLDNIRSLRGEELIQIDSNRIDHSYFTDETNYYLNENYTLVVQKDIQDDIYWVVSIVPDFVPAGHTNNRYYQDGWFINFYYDIVDRNLFQGLGISVVVMLLSFGFLVCAAGHRKAVDGIVLTAFDRIPLEVVSGSVVVIEFILLLMLDIIMSEPAIYRSAYATMGTFGLFGIIMIVVAIAYVLSICVRIKAGKWWRNSICYRIYSWIRGLIGYIFRHIGLLWKTVMIVGVISFVEFCVLVNFDRGSMAMLWLVEKLILCVILCVLVIQMHELQRASQYMAEGELSYKINTAKMFWECRKHGENLNKIGEGMSKAVDERMKSERLKTELITNVSHDIKTPLTSIINYVDLLSKEELHNDKAAEYLEVLDRQSSKLKKLIEDLVEASKASSGNLAVDSQQLEAGVFVTQTVGEFEEKLSLAGLELIVNKPEEPVYIMADGRHIWRVVDNLMNNICKYSQIGSRVYVSLEATEQNVSITFRNISKYPLNVSGEELIERFVRGDKSRNTEGHGLGLSIAQSLMKLIGGKMDVSVDGDLFKVVLTFDRYASDMLELALEK